METEPRWEGGISWQGLLKHGYAEKFVSSEWEKGNLRTSIETLKKKQMQILELKNTISAIILGELNSRLVMTKKSINFRNEEHN